MQSIHATVCVAGGVPYLRLEDRATIELGGSGVRGLCRGHRFVAATIRLPGELHIHGLALPRALMSSCGLVVGTRVTLEVEDPPRDDGRIHPAAAEALSEAGANLSALDAKERRLALTLVREAGSSHTRRERIEALIEACLKAQAKEID